VRVEKKEKGTGEKTCIATLSFPSKLDMKSFFVKLCSASLDNTKINFCHVQGYFSEEIFIPLKGVGVSKKN
jgi:hypothetical protein